MRMHFFTHFTQTNEPTKIHSRSIPNLPKGWNVFLLLIGQQQDGKNEFL